MLRWEHLGLVCAKIAVPVADRFSGACREILSLVAPNFTVKTEVEGSNHTISDRSDFATLFGCWQLVKLCEGQKVPQSPKPGKFKVAKNQKVTLGVDPKVTQK